MRASWPREPLLIAGDSCVLTFTSSASTSGRSGVPGAPRRGVPRAPRRGIPRAPTSTSIAQQHQPPPPHTLTTHLPEAVTQQEAAGVQQEEEEEEEEDEEEKEEVEGFRATVTGYSAEAFAVECTHVFLTHPHTVTHATRPLHATSSHVVSQVPSFDVC